MCAGEQPVNSFFCTIDLYSGSFTSYPLGSWFESRIRLTQADICNDEADVESKMWCVYLQKQEQAYEEHKCLKSCFSNVPFLSVRLTFIQKQSGKQKHIVSHEVSARVTKPKTWNLDLVEEHRFSKLRSGINKCLNKHQLKIQFYLKVLTEIFFYSEHELKILFYLNHQCMIQPYLKSLT